MEAWQRSALKRRQDDAEQARRRAKDGTFWLLECGEQPVLYWCGGWEWCNNPNHAYRCETKDEATGFAAILETRMPIRVCDHSWTKPNYSSARGV